MTQEIYGWHIIHNETGSPYAFCLREIGDITLTEGEILEDLGGQHEFTLIPLVLAVSQH